MALLYVMSAIIPKADISDRSDVRFGQSGFLSRIDHELSALGA
jgi:hypothetical protein